MKDEFNPLLVNHTIDYHHLKLILKKIKSTKKVHVTNQKS
jgi:hypothetical protein